MERARPLLRALCHHGATLTLTKRTRPLWQDTRGSGWVLRFPDGSADAVDPRQVVSIARYGLLRIGPSPTQQMVASLEEQALARYGLELD